MREGVTPSICCIVAYPRQVTYPQYKPTDQRSDEAYPSWCNKCNKAINYPSNFRCMMELRTQESTTSLQNTSTNATSYSHAQPVDATESAMSSAARDQKYSCNVKQFESTEFISSSTKEHKCTCGQQDVEKSLPPSDTSISSVETIQDKPNCSCGKRKSSNEEISFKPSRTEPPINQICSASKICGKPETPAPTPAANYDTIPILAPCGRPMAESQTILSSDVLNKCSCQRKNKDSANKETQYGMRELSAKPSSSKCPCKVSQNVQPAVEPPEELSPCGRPKTNYETYSSLPAQGTGKCPCARMLDKKESPYSSRNASAKTLSKCPCKASQTTQKISPSEDLLSCAKPVEDKPPVNYPTDKPNKCQCSRAYNSEPDIPKTSTRESFKYPSRRSQTELGYAGNSQKEYDNSKSSPAPQGYDTQLPNVPSSQSSPSIPAPRHLLNNEVQQSSDPQGGVQSIIGQLVTKSLSFLQGENRIPSKQSKSSLNESPTTPAPKRSSNDHSQNIEEPQQEDEELINKFPSSSKLGEQTSDQMIPSQQIPDIPSNTSGTPLEPQEKNQQDKIQEPSATRMLANEPSDQSVSTHQPPSSNASPVRICTCGKEQQTIGQDRYSPPIVSHDAGNDISLSTCRLYPNEEVKRIPDQKSSISCCHCQQNTIGQNESDESASRDETIIVIRKPNIYCQPKTNIHQAPLRYPTMRGQIKKVDRELPPLRLPYQQGVLYSTGYGDIDFPPQSNLREIDQSPANQVQDCACRNEPEFSSQTLTPATFGTDTSLLQSSAYRGTTRVKRSSNSTEEEYYSLSSSEAEQCVTIIECPAANTKSSAYKTPETYNSKEPKNEEHPEESEQSRNKKKSSSRSKRNRSEENPTKNMVILKLLHEVVHLINEDSSMSETSSVISKPKIRNIGTFGDTYANVGAFSSRTNLSSIKLTIIPESNRTELTESPSLNCVGSCNVMAVPKPMLGRSCLPNFTNAGTATQSFINWNSGLGPITCSIGANMHGPETVEMGNEFCMCFSCTDEQDMLALPVFNEIPPQVSNTSQKPIELSQTPIEIRTELVSAFDYLTDTYAEEGEDGEDEEEEEYNEMISEYNTIEDAGNNEKEKSKADENEKTECDCCHCRSVRSGICDTIATSKQTIDGDNSNPCKEMKYFIDSIILDLDAMEHARQKRMRNNFVPGNKCQTVATRSFPVTITDVSVLASAALYVKWCIHDCYGIGGYEIYVDGHLTNRYFNYFHEACVICEIDTNQPHKIVLVAQPMNKENIGDNASISKDTKSEKNRSLALNITHSPKTVWTPSIYYYDPINNEENRCSPFCCNDDDSVL